MKKIILFFLLFSGFGIFAQEQFTAPTFTYNGQTYNVDNYGVGIVIKNTNQIYYQTDYNLRPPEGGEKYCNETEFPVNLADIGNKLVALNATLFTKLRRGELSMAKEIVGLALVAPAGNTQITEVVFRLNSNTKLTQEEIYKMEQAYKNLRLVLYPHTCTYRYVVSNLYIHIN